MSTLADHQSWYGHWSIFYPVDQRMAWAKGRHVDFHDLGHDCKSVCNVKERHADIVQAVIVECVSTVWWHFTIAKLIAGIGIGCVQATLPVVSHRASSGKGKADMLVYQRTCSYPDSRIPRRSIQHVSIGFLCLRSQLTDRWFSLGGLLAGVGLSVINTNSPYNWRLPVYTQFGMIGLAIIIYIFLPESPWWLVSKGRLEDARKILQKKNSSVPGYDLDAELGIIVHTIELQRQEAKLAKLEGPLSMLQGLNLKRFLIGSYPKVSTSTLTLALR
jgi:SP family general alpha glucoside:H+ symporter-like MFS transporter